MHGVGGGLTFSFDMHSAGLKTWRASVAVYDKNSLRIMKH